MAVLTVFDKCFFEKTRLEIMKDAVCVCADGALVYANRCFKILARRAKTDKLTNGSAIKNELASGAADIYEITFGRRSLKFAGATVNLFDRSIRLFLDTKMCGRHFPILYKGYAYISLETLYGRVYLPLFGGELYGESDDKNSRRLLASGERMKRIGSVTDIGIKYFCISSFIDLFCERFGSKVMNFGYSVRNDLRGYSMAVCLASAYDVSAVLELLACCALKNTEGRAGVFTVSENEGCCTVSFVTENRKSTVGSRISLEERFELGTDENRVVRSLIKFCDMYSWKLTFRESVGRMTYSLTLPMYNRETLKFKEEDDKELIAAIDEAMKLLAP